MAKYYKKMFNILDRYLKDKVEDIDTSILSAFEDRKNGKIFNFKEHLRGFIYAQLSALVSWKKIKSNLANIDNIFCQYNKEKLKQKSAEDLITEITEIKCNNPYTTKNQMRSLKANIETFEKIEKDFSGIEKFITCHSPINIVKLLADSNSTYKLRYSGVALVCEYLRNMGIDIVKPDVHLKRILAPDRLNLVSSKSDYAVIGKCKQLSNEIGISQIKIDYLLWNYCAKGYGEVCTKKPKCEKCVISEYCLNNTKPINNRQDVKKVFIVKKATEYQKTDTKENNFYKMDKISIRNYSEHIATEKLLNNGYKFINISTGREYSLFRITNNNENMLARFMFYRFNPKVKNNYAWILKKNFNDIDYSYLVFVVYVVNSVHVLLIPASDVIDKFESRDYEGLKSPPEWGINLSYQIINFLIAHYEMK